MIQKVGKTVFNIGSRLYPLASRSKARVFDKDSWAVIDNAALRHELDRLKFEAGRCYSNADLVVRIAKRLGLDASFYAGWLFFGGPPMHHAWAVVGDSLVDTSLSRSELKWLGQVDPKDPRWRERVAPSLAIQRELTLTTDDCIFGQIPETLIYVGCPDEANNARRIFRKLLEEYPDHPSYRYSREKTGESQLQRVVRSLRGNSI